VTTSTITIDPRFCGPPSSGNGGYSAGLAATALTDGPAEVTLFGPPPLGRALQVVVEDGCSRVLDGDTLVMEASSAEPIEVGIDAVTYDEVLAAEAAFDLERYAANHPFDSCYACGPARAPGDGLRIFPGEVADRDRVVAWRWTPDPSTAGQDGGVAAPHLWAALDCISSWPWFVGRDDPPPMVLGRMGAAIVHAPEPGSELIAASWPIAANGRKHRSGSALWSLDGGLLALGWATWIQLTEEQAAAFTA
jgi:hypothetical protein